MVAGVALPPETPAVVSGAGDAALPSEVAVEVIDGGCAVPLLGEAAGAGAGAHLSKMYSSSFSSLLSPQPPSTSTGLESLPSV